MRDIILVAAVLIAGLVALRRPLIGMLTFAFLGFFNPQSYTWSFGRTFPLSQVIAISTILGLLISSEPKKWPRRREAVILLLLWVTFLVSSIFAIYPEKAFDRFIDISKILVMIFVALMVINSEERLHSLIRIIGCSLGFYALKGGIFAIVSGGGYIVYGPDISFLTANNSIGLALAMNIPVLLYLLKKEEQQWFRWILKAMLVFSYPAIVCTYSRGAWLGMIIVTVLSILKSRRKFLTVAVAGVVIVVLQAVIPQIAPDRLFHRYDQLVDYKDDSSAESRFWNWEFCRRVGMGRPLTGGGFNFSSIENYARFYPEFLARWPGKQWTCHSTWLTIFGEHGFPGAILWLFLLACCFMSLRQIRVYGQSSPENNRYVQFADMAQSSMVGFLVVGTFLDAAYFDLFYYLVAFIIIMKELMAPAMNDLRSLARSQALGLATSIGSQVESAP